MPSSWGYVTPFSQRLLTSCLSCFFFRSLCPHRLVLPSPSTTPAAPSLVNCSAAFAPASDVECTVEDDTSRACQEYQAKLEELQRLVTEIPKLERVKTLAEEIQAIKLRDPVAAAASSAASASGGSPAPDSPELRAALERAREISRQVGSDAPEARVAWEAVEEIASAGLGNAMGPRLDEECLVESSLQACLALEELSRVVNLQRVKEQGMADF